MSKSSTMITINAEYDDLDAWMKNPRGYAVVVCPDDVAHIEVDDSWNNVQVIEVNASGVTAAKVLAKFRDEFDVDPNGFSPRLIVITREVFVDPINSLFVRRAMVIIERF